MPNDYDKEFVEFTDRRSFLRSGIAAGAGLAAFEFQSRLTAAELRNGVTFSFGTYGMKSLTTEAAIQAVADIGYDGIEIAARADWDAAPMRMSKQRRDDVRNRLTDSGLQLTALMEHLFPSRDEAEHRAGLARLRQVAKLGHDLSPDAPPLIQTVLGGGTWDDQKTMFLDRLSDWAELAAETETVIAIKPHRGGGMSTPSEAVWLIRELGNTPWIRMVYDYSHYAFRDMPIAQTVETALPYTAHIAIKDALKTENGFRFVLPGESASFDYADLFRRFYDGGYRSDICCEVSGMVSNQPGYDPIAAAKTCYANIAPQFEKANVPRRRR
ncbi:MAG: sugar phosphate isomerase/epimerase [Planctomycetaceae bacterium]|nr:sugar phosphate isomerase/epimerase [Planctomycetales bacterium]MCB9927102.1 sugar phosphate isomerase/epimerase [Planctomycetaceae bacterium]